jgi:hypothetical protein
MPGHHLFEQGEPPAALEQALGGRVFNRRGRVPALRLHRINGDRCLASPSFQSPCAIPFVCEEMLYRSHQKGTESAPLRVGITP